MILKAVGKLWLGCVLISSLGVPVSAGVLLQDDFSSQGIDSSKWRVEVPTVEFSPGRKANSSVNQLNGQMNVSGRGYLVTHDQYMMPILQVEGDATFTDIVGGDWTGEVGGAFWGLPDAEFLNIQLRTSGIPSPRLFREATDGLAFRIIVTPRKPGKAPPATIVDILQYVTNPPKPGTIVNGPAMTDLTSVTSSVLNLTEGDAVHFTVIDDGQNVTFRVAKIVNGTPSIAEVETLTASAPNVDTNHFVAFYDREAPNVGNTRTVSLDNLVIASVPEPTGGILLLSVVGAIGRRRCRNR